MLRYSMSSCTSSHTWCYATLRLLALPHIHDATLLYVFLHFFLHFRTYLMLRHCTSSCPASHTWCYATVRLLALPHIHDATLLYVFLAVEMGKQLQQKPLQADRRGCEEHLAQKKEKAAEVFDMSSEKYLRAHFLRKFNYERCKTTVIYGMKWMMNSANVGNAGSINHPPGCISMTFENLMCICETLKPRCIKQL